VFAVSEKFRTFRDLDCWKACRELRVFAATTVLPALPRDEKYRLGDQLIRAARSTTANIAEGYGRYHYLDTAKFCSNARGSAYEVLDHLITAQDEEMITAVLFTTGEKLVEQSVKLLNGYTHYLQKTSRATGVHE
jgi:four helix bundle protein